MKKYLSNHPCFNDKVRHMFARLHLPVAPKCNIQCNFCNRKYDCVNESRPGVTSRVLAPHQAFLYLNRVMDRVSNISVVGIAGPGDPFTNAKETMETLKMVREKYQDMILCLATNGLEIGPYIEAIAQLKVSHVTITINAVDLEVGAKIYSWVKYEGKVYDSGEGFKILLDKQLKAVKSLKEKGITVKVNSIIIPGINDYHFESIVKKMSELRVDVQNCIPYYPTKGTVFENIKEPLPELVKNIRGNAGKQLKQMYHCVRCRADAVGLLGKDDMECFKILKECGNEKI